MSNCCSGRVIRSLGSRHSKGGGGVQVAYTSVKQRAPSALVDYS
jgi:hypothetical protein